MNGFIYDAVTLVAERYLLGAIRGKLCAPLRGDVIDVGAGTGANFPYYHADARVIAIEPDKRMLVRAERRIRGSHAEIQLIGKDDSYLDTLAPGSGDAVVFTLVLCTVPDPLRTLQRARRVLRPGGTLAILEHVRSDGFLGALQDSADSVWGILAGGCHLKRRTADLISSVGFDLRSVRSLHVPGGIIAKLIAGHAG